MIYLVLILSIALNGIFFWYVRKLLGKLQDEVDVREAYKQMLGDYANSLQNMYKLEELYGEEIIKRAINETRFVIEATEEFKKTIEVPRQAASEAQDEGEETNKDSGEERDEDERPQARTKISGTYTEVEPWEAKEGFIRLREGEKVSQDASSYRRVTADI